MNPNYTTKEDIEKCWKKSHSANVQQIDAFIYYLCYLSLKPADMIQTKNQIEAALLSVMVLPVTIPIAVMTAPVFFVSRKVSVVKQKITQFLEKRNEEKMNNFIHENGAQIDRQISPETWKKAVNQATNKLFIKNKKRMIIVNELAQSKEKDQNTEKKQFIFIMDEDKALFDVLYLLKKELKREADSIYLIMEAKILNSSTKISALKANQLGIISVGFTKIETFG